MKRRPWPAPLRLGKLICLYNEAAIGDEHLRLQLNLLRQ